MRIEDAAKLLQEAFVQRTDAFAIHKKNGQYCKVDRELSDEVLKSHLEGKQTIGAYQLNKESKVKSVGFDFDGPDLNAELEKARVLCEKLRAQGIHCLLEFSGKKGYHVLVLCEETSAAVARQWAEKVSKGCNVHEVFPKQETIIENGYGNCIKLPFGVHQVTGKRSHLLDENLEPLGVVDGFKALEDAVKNRNKLPDRTKLPTREKILKSCMMQQTNIPEIVKNLVSAGANEGERHERAFIIIKEMFHAGFSKKETTEYALAFNEKCRPPKTKKIIKDHVKRLLGNPEKYLKQKEGEENVEEKEEPSIHPELVVYNLDDFAKLKPDKNALVEDRILPLTIVMLYAAPKNFKSLLSDYMGLCLATGKKFLGLKTKKTNVLLIDNENNKNFLKQRLLGICAPLKIKRRKGVPFYVATGLDLLNRACRNQIIEFVQKKKISFVILDTLRRCGNFDENSSNDINKLHKEIFLPLRKCGCTTMFLHHSGKSYSRNKPPQYRGSSDLLGSIDAAFYMERKEVRGETTNEFKLVCTHSRAGEPDKLYANIDFSGENIAFETIEAVEEEDTKKKFLQICDKIKSFFDGATEMKRSEILKCFEALETSGEIEKGWAPKRSIDNALSWMVTRSKDLKKAEKGVYVKNWGTIEQEKQQKVGNYVQK
jgi:hypothetical protein